MLVDKSENCRYLASLAFLIGAAIALTTCVMCSEHALTVLGDSVALWYRNYGTLAPFAVDMLFVLLVLLFSVSTIGFLFVPILDCLFGFSVAFLDFILIKDGISFSPQYFFLLLDLAAVLPVLRISSLGLLSSLHVFRVWRSSGNRIYDLRPIIHSIWFSLMILFILLPLRFLCGNFPFSSEWR